jgi:serine/threonine protein kinase
VALKQIRAESREEGIPVTTLREIALLNDLHHANIAKLLEVISEDNKV